MNARALLLPGGGICRFYNGHKRKDVHGIKVHAKVLQNTVIWKYCNGHGNMDAHGMKKQPVLQPYVIDWTYYAGLLKTVVLLSLMNA
jgi:hypothetical protein